MRRVVFNQKVAWVTSITCNLAAISAEQGLRTLVVDLDVQGNSSYYLGLDIHGPDIPSPDANIAQLLRQSASTWFCKCLTRVKLCARNTV